MRFQSEEHLDWDRSVPFSGISQLVFCLEPSTYLDFAKCTVTVNNLGGNGPDADPSAAHKSRYSNIGASADG